MATRSVYTQDQLCLLWVYSAGQVLAPNATEVLAMVTFCVCERFASCRLEFRENIAGSLDKGQTKVRKHVATAPAACFLLTLHHEPLKHSFYGRAFTFSPPF